jgi:hypothetical protein
MKFKNSNENVIYEVVTDNNDSSYLVSLDQVFDIVREEDWIHGGCNCLVSLASSQNIMLKKTAAKSNKVNYQVKTCKLAILLLLKVMVINGHTRLI